MITFLVRVARLLGAVRSVRDALGDLLAVQRAHAYRAGFQDGRAFERGKPRDDREAGL